MIRPWVASAEQAGVTSSEFTAFEMGALESLTASEVLPREGWICRIEVELSGISGAPTQATAWASHDQNGAQAITPNGTSGATQTLSATGDGDASKGGATFNLDRTPYITLDGLWVWVRLDNGTADCTVRIWGETTVPPSR